MVQVGERNRGVIKAELADPWLWGRQRGDFFNEQFYEDSFGSAQFAG